MTSCDDFEVWIEMRLHGALPPADAALLDEHLAGCERCRAFETIARSTKEMMVETARAEAQDVDWKALRGAIALRLGRNMKLRVGIFLGFVVAETIAILLFNSSHLWVHILPNFALVSLLGLAVVLLVSMVRKNRLRKYESSREDLLFFQRASLEQGIRGLDFGVPVLSIFAFAYPAVRLYNGGATLGEWLGAGLMMLMLGGSAAYLHFVEKKRLTRELDAFKRR